MFGLDDNESTEEYGKHSKERQGRIWEEVEVGRIPGRRKNGERYYRLLCYACRSLPQRIIRECTTPGLHKYDTKEARTGRAAVGDPVEGST